MCLPSYILCAPVKHKQFILAKISVALLWLYIKGGWRVCSQKWSQGVLIPTRWLAGVKVRWIFVSSVWICCLMTLAANVQDGSVGVWDILASFLDSGRMGGVYGLYLDVFDFCPKGKTSAINWQENLGNYDIHGPQRMNLTNITAWMTFPL